MKRDILIFANDETTIYSFRREIIRAFSANSYNTVVCIPKGIRTEEIEACGCRVVNIAVSRHGTDPFRDLGYLINCLKLIKKYNPGVVLTYTVKPNIYASLACQMAHKPYINNVTGLGTALQKDSVLSKLILSLQRMAYRKSSCVFFQNQANYQTLLEKKVVSDSTPYEILPGSGVNLELYSYVPMRADDGIVRFIIVSRIREDKGYTEFLQAAERIRSSYPNTEFHVVGGYEEEKLKADVERLVSENVVIYHGSQTQEKVHELVASCDCLVLPSYHEGMANVLLEAAATGRPVVATDIPGCRETFDEGITGFGCKVKDVDSLVSAMEKVINMPYNERVEMGEKGRIKIEKEFDRQIVADRYLTRISKIIRGK